MAEWLVETELVGDLVKLYPHVLTAIGEPKAKWQIDATKSQSRSYILNEQSLRAGACGQFCREPAKSARSKSMSAVDCYVPFLTKDNPARCPDVDVLPDSRQSVRKLAGIVRDTAGPRGVLACDQVPDRSRTH